METIRKLAAILQPKDAAGSQARPYSTSISFEEIVQQLLDRLEIKNTDCFQEFFDCVEQELIFSERPVQDMIIIELLEGLKNHATWRDIDYAMFEPWLGPETHVAWRWLEKKWKGKTSLVDTASEL